MRIKSKYKIARRLGPAVFEKTQTQKFAARSGQYGKRPGRPATDFGKALIEKQKARFTYLINERQFKNYVKKALQEKKKKPEESLFEKLESRLDNTVARLGLAETRLAARQMVSHGHISLNGRRVNFPSCSVKPGDLVSVVERSRKSKLFADLVEKMKDRTLPKWLSFEVEKMEGKVLSAPKLETSELSFDLSSILDFYKR